MASSFYAQHAIGFRAGLGAGGIQIRAGSSLASVFLATGVEVWRDPPWLYLGSFGRVSGQFGHPGMLTAWGEKRMPGGMPALPENPFISGSKWWNVEKQSQLVPEVALSIPSLCEAAQVQPRPQALAGLDTAGMGTPGGTRWGARALLARASLCPAGCAKGSRLSPTPQSLAQDWW